MYTDRLMAKTFGGWFGPEWDREGRLPAITLSFMPVSHIMGRVILYSTLGAGGTAYFAAKADLSTLLEDLALVRPTKLDLVPACGKCCSKRYRAKPTSAPSTAPIGRPSNFR